MYAAISYAPMHMPMGLPFVFKLIMVSKLSEGDIVKTSLFEVAVAWPDNLKIDQSKSRIGVKTRLGKQELP